MAEEIKKDNFFRKVGRFFARLGKKLAKLFSDTRHEMRKVRWTPKAELKTSTVLVVAVVLVTAVCLGLVDTAFSWLINFVAGLIG